MKSLNIPLKVSIIVSVFNEEEVLPKFINEIIPIIRDLEYSCEIIFVNDGSIDNSPLLLSEFASKYQYVKAIHFSRNFGHEAAMLAGLENCSGDVAVCLDSDLQHPPILIPEIVDKYREGNDIITMVRNSREDAGLLKKITSKFFYSFLNRISDYKIEPNASDFFLVSRRVIEVLKSDFQERTRFLRGFIQMMGFKKANIEYIAPARQGGKSKYTLMRLLILTATAISSTSRAPLRLSLVLGIVFGMLAIVVAIYSLVEKILGNPFSGYTSIIVLLSIGFSLLFVLLGIIGQYLGDIFIEVKKRPIYIIDKMEE